MSSSRGCSREGRLRRGGPLTAVRGSTDQDHGTISSAARRSRAPAATRPTWRSSPGRTGPSAGRSDSAARATTYGNAVGVDTAGNSIATGYFRNAIDFGRLLHFERRWPGRVRRQLRPTGGHRSSRGAGGLGDDSGRGIAVDARRSRTGRNPHAGRILPEYDRPRQREPSPRPVSTTRSSPSWPSDASQGSLARRPRPPNRSSGRGYFSATTVLFCLTAKDPP
jgi:hypothetical protein